MSFFKRHYRKRLKRICFQEYVSFDRQNKLRKYIQKLGYKGNSTFDYSDLRNDFDIDMCGIDIYTKEMLLDTRLKILLVDWFL